MKRILLLVLICACKTTSSAETHVAASAAETLNTDQQTDTHIVDAPDRTTTTVEEFAPPEGKAGGRILTGVPGLSTQASVPPGVRPAAAAPVDQDRTRDANVPDHGPLVKRTVTVTEHGAVTIDKHVDAKSQEREDSILSSESKTKSSTDFLHSPFALLGGLVALAGVGFVAFKILKPRLL